MAALGMTPDGVSGNRKDFRAFAREAYTRCVVAYRSISLISRGMGMIPWYVSIDGELVENEEEPFTKMLRRPNPEQGTCAYFETLSSWLLLAGNSYPLKITSDSEEPGANGQKRPLELHFLRSDRVTVDSDEETGEKYGYWYQVGSNKTYYPIDPITRQSDVLQLLFFNPTDDQYGLAPVEPGSYGIDRHNAGNEWNYRLLKNSAKPAGVLEYDPGESGMDLTDEQRDRIKRQLRDRNEGELNAGRMLLLEGYLKWKQMGLSPTDMDFSAGMDNAGRQVASTYGVPPMLVGIPGESTFANYKEARLALWEDTIIPLATYIRDEFNNWLSPGFGAGVRLDMDLDNIPAIAEKRVSLWEKLEATSFLELNEKREAAGYDEVDGGDVILINAGKIPLETGFDEEEPEEPEEPDDDLIIEDIDEPPGIEDLPPDKAGKLAYGK
jgi:HK97 family phage portal protein